MKKLKLFTNYFVLLAECSFLIFLISSLITCSSDKDDDGLSYEYVQNNIINVQEDKFDKLESLLAKNDTASALDSIERIFLRDKNVDQCYKYQQGIWIKYKNGMLGGIVLGAPNAKLKEIDQFSVQNKPGNMLRKSNSIAFGQSGYAEDEYIVPASKKTAMICSDYSTPDPLINMKNEVDLMVSNYNDRLPWVGYDKMKTFYDHDVTLDLLASLSGYGIIHISCHGGLYPNETNPEKVFLFTGEVVNEYTTLRYFNLSNFNQLSLITRKTATTNQVETRFAVSAEFIGDHNDFTKDSTLIYCGMCYGYFGNWPETFIFKCHAAGYFCFDWAPKLDQVVSFDFRLFQDLCDTEVKKPWTCREWMNDDFIPKWYWDYKYKRAIWLKYFGYDNLALWRKGTNLPGLDTMNLYCVWYAKNIGFQPIIVGTKADYLKVKYCYTYPGGGNDKTLIMEKSELLTQGHHTKEAAIQAVCGMFSSVWALPPTSTFVYVDYFGLLNGERHDVDELHGCGIIP